MRRLHDPQIPIAERRAQAKARVDREAEAVRLRYITPGDGQQAVYIRKAQEAERYLAGENGPFPLLEASVGIEAPDVAGVAAIVAGIAEQWIGVAAVIEAKRLGAKKAIDEAATPAAIDAAAAVDWTIPGA